MNQMKDIFISSGAQIIKVTELRTVWRTLSKFDEIDFQTARDVKFSLISKNQTDIWSKRIKLHQKKCGERNFETKVLKGVTLTHIFCGHHQPRSKFHRSHRDVMFEWWRAFAPNRRQCRQAAKQKRYDLGDSVEKQSALNINKSLTMLNGILFVEE